jgi:hypothetical protein
MTTATTSTVSSAIANPATTGLCRRDHLRSRCTTVGRRARIGSSFKKRSRSSASSCAVA